MHILFMNILHIPSNYYIINIDKSYIISIYKYFRKMLLRLSANSIKLGYRCTAQKTSALNILRLQPQSILSCDNKRFFSRERTTAHYNIKVIIFTALFLLRIIE